MAALGYVVGVILAIVISGSLVRAIMRSLWVPLHDRHPDESRTPSMTALYGAVESAGFSVAWMAAMPAAIGFWLAYKAAAFFRASKPEHASRDLINVTLTGTILSVAAGVTSGMVGIALADAPGPVGMVAVWRASIPVVIFVVFGLGLAGYVRWVVAPDMKRTTLRIEESARDGLDVGGRNLSPPYHARAKR